MMLKRSVYILLLCLLPMVYAVGESVTATVQSYNSATLAGDVTVDMQVEYDQQQETHHKSRLLAGESALLRLTGLPAGRLDSVTVMVHSNQSSGAGSMTLTVGTEQRWVIADAAFNSASWYGAYSSDYVSLTHALGCASGDVVLQLQATANSLYFQSLTLYYTPNPPVCYTVSFSTQTASPCPSAVEPTPGAGIVLPALPDPNDEWLFVGWTEQYTDGQAEMPTYRLAGTHYYPNCDIQLYALYQSRMPMQSIKPDTLRQSGVYAICAGAPFMQMAVGPALQREVPMQPCVLTEVDGRDALTLAYVPTEARYRLDFEGDSVLITALGNNSRLGYHHTSSSDYLAQDKVRWAWLNGADATICLHHHASGNEARIMMPDGNMDDDSYHLTDQRLALSATEHYLLLYPVDDLPEEADGVLYSCYPKLSAIDYATPAIDESAAIEVYTIDGRLIGTMLPSALPSGMWIVRQGGVTRKIMR